MGMDRVPVVYGMTIGEYALMVNGEGWLKDGEKCNLQVIPCLHYDHSTTSILPVAPSPNLPDQQAVQVIPFPGVLSVFSAPCLINPPVNFCVDLRNLRENFLLLF